MKISRFALRSLLALCSLIFVLPSVSRAEVAVEIRLLLTPGDAVVRSSAEPVSPAARYAVNTFPASERISYLNLAGASGRNPTARNRSPHSRGASRYGARGGTGFSDFAHHRHAPCGNPGGFQVGSVDSGARHSFLCGCRSFHSMYEPRKGTRFLGASKGCPVHHPRGATRAVVRKRSVRGSYSGKYECENNYSSSPVINISYREYLSAHGGTSSHIPVMYGLQAEHRET